MGIYQPRGMETLPAYALSPITPGAYMKALRERSGKSIEACARAIALAEHDVCHARNDLQLMEDDQPGDFYRLAKALKDRNVFAFDMSTFLSLARATAAVERDPWADI